MRLLLPVVCLLPAACTPAPEPLPPDRGDLVAQAIEHGRDATWIDAPLVPGLGGAWQLRSGGLRTYVAPDRLVVVDRSELEPAWQLEVAATAWGRQGAMVPLEGGTIWAEGPRLELQRGPVTEWLVNGEDGLEHGFTLPEPPPGSGPVTVRLEVDGLQAVAMRDGARFVDRAGPRVDWRGLVVRDAEDQVLEAWTDVRDGALLVAFDDTTATWPVEVDPLFTSLEQQVDLSGHGPSPAWTGFSLAGDGDLLLLGNPGVLSDYATDGVGVLVARNTGGADAWLDVETVDPATGDTQIGYAVALSLPLLAISSPAGGVWVQANEDGVWTDEAHLTKKGGGGFGTSLALDRGILAVGWPDDNSGVAGSGSVTVYGRHQGGTGAWGEVTQLRHTLGLQDAGLGEATAISGDVIVGGAPNDAGQGFALVWRFDSATGSWVEDAELELGSGGNGDRFGAAVAADPGFVLVGAPGAERASVFEHWNGVWTEQELLPPPEAGPGFGTRVAISGDTLVVGDLPATGTARVHLYELRASGWSYVESLDAGPTTGAAALPLVLEGSLLAAGLPESASLMVWRRTAGEWVEDVQTQTAGSRFGAAVASDGQYAAVGAPLDDTNGARSGTTHLYRNDGQAWTWLADMRCPGIGECGTSVDLVDGLLVQGAPITPATAVWPAGTAFVYQLEDDTTPQLVASLHAPSGSVEGFGEAVALAPPFLAVGAPDRGTDSQGAVDLFRYDSGSGSWALQEELTVGLQPDDRMGATLAARDGMLFAGAPQADSFGLSDNGQVQVWRLDSTEPEVVAALPGLATGDELGSDIAISGDLLAIGAAGASAGTGKVYTYAVRHADTPGLPYVLHGEIQASVPTSGSRFGAALALSGDRLIVGAPGAGLAEVRLRNQGGADAFGWVQTLTGDPAGEHGAAVAASPDTVIVGEPQATSGDGAVHFYDLHADLPPVARGDAYQVDEDVVLQVPQDAPSVLDNDHEPNGDTLTAIIVSNPTHALSFGLTPDGTFTYVPELDNDQDDAFSYRVSDGVNESGVVTVTIDVVPINDPPVAAPDTGFVTDEEVLLFVPAPGVLANDTDADDTALDAAIAQDAAHGSVTLAADGSFTYTPDAEFFGTDTFRYVTRDDEGAESEEAEVLIEVLPLNDPPVVPPALAVETDEDAAFIAAPPGLLDPAQVSDPDGDRLTTRISSGSSTFGAVLVYENGAWRYTPPPEFSGLDLFQIEVGDGTVWVPVTVQVTVAEINDPPIGTPDDAATQEDRPLLIDPDTLVVDDVDVEPGALTAVLEPALPPEHGTVGVDPVSGRFVYTPDPDTSGTDVFHYRARDTGNAESDPVPVQITITAVNDAPLAQDDDLGEAVGTAEVTGQVLTNDSDPDGDAVTAELSSPPTGGDVTLSPDGSLTYTARAGFVGPDRFLYVAVDSQGARSAPAAVDVVVLPGDETTPATPTDTGCEEVTLYLDADGDGHGDPSISVQACGTPEQYVAEAGDCDDSRADVHPAAREVSGDDVDQDCDGLKNHVRPAGCATTGPGAPLGALLLATLLVLARPARASDLCAEDTAADVDAAVASLWDAWGRVDEADFDRASKNLEFTVACLDAVPTGAQVARLHQGMALVAFVNGQTRASRRSLTAARLADPGWKLPEDRFPASHPFRAEWAAATNPGPVTPLGDISPEQWVVDGIVREDAPTERAFLLQVMRDEQVAWTRYLWTRDEVPDRGQNSERSPFEAPRAWQLGLGLHGRALSSRQQATNPAAEDASGLGLGGGVELGVRATPTSVVGGELSASLTSGADPVLGGGGSPSARAVVLLGGGGWAGDLQPWGAARLGAGIDRMRAWTHGTSDLQAEIVTVASAAVGVEGGLRTDAWQARLAADVLLEGAQRPWLLHARADGATLVSDPLALQACLDLRTGGLPLEDVDGTEAGRRSELDLRLGAALLLWL